MTQFRCIFPKIPQTAECRLFSCRPASAPAKHRTSIFAVTSPIPEKITTNCWMPVIQLVTLPVSLPTIKTRANIFAVTSPIPEKITTNRWMPVVQLVTLPVSLQSTEPGPVFITSPIPDVSLCVQSINLFRVYTLQSIFDWELIDFDDFIQLKRKILKYNTCSYSSKYNNGMITLKRLKLY